MIVVRHQAIDMEVGGKPLVGFPENLQKIQPIIIGEEDRLLLVSSGINVIISPRIFDPETSGHEKSTWVLGLSVYNDAELGREFSATAEYYKN
jgi:hypothetical protein